MTASRRILNDPAWLLNHRPFRNTSRILDIFSLNHGRLSVVARGSRSAKSKLRGILRPFLPLQLSWVIRSDLGTLTGAELNGSPLSLSGDSLLSGYYLNELLLRFLHRHDPQPEIFAAYSDPVQRLAGQPEVARQLRVFEIELLRILGYALNLDHDAKSRQSLLPEQQYEYRIEQGPVAVSGRDGPMVFSGRRLRAISRQEFSQPDVLRDAGRLLREVIAHHLGGKELKSRAVMRELREAAAGGGRTHGSDDWAS